MGVAPKLGVSLGVVDGFLGRPTRAESLGEPGTNSRSPFIRDERREQSPGQPAPDERVLRGEPGSEEEANLPENPSDQEPPPSEPEGGPDQVGSAEPQPAAVGVARRYVEIRELIATGDADAIGRALEDLAAMAPGAARHAEFAELRRIAEDRREQLRLRGSL